MQHIDGPCGACNATSGVLIAWLGSNVSLNATRERPRCTRYMHCEAETVASSHPSIFAQAPTLDKNGALSFALHTEQRVRLLCYKTCVHLTPPASHADASPIQLEVRRDPCTADTNCYRSVFWHTSFHCRLGAEWSRIFSRFDGLLTFGLHAGIAVIGGADATRAPTAFKAFNSGDGDDDEPCKHNPAWDAGLPLERKLRAGASFVPPASLTYPTMRGQHEYQVAWLAAQDAGWPHVECSPDMVRRFGCHRGTDAHKSIARFYRKHFASTDAMQAAAVDMCTWKHAANHACARYREHSSDCVKTSMRGVRRPASLSFNAHVVMLQAYQGRLDAKLEGAGHKDDHYVDIGATTPPAPSEQNLSHAIPLSFVRRLSESLRWLVRNHDRLNVTVAMVGVLTHQLFMEDPVADDEIAASLAKLQAAGVVVLANGGNCRRWWRNCSGLPWPAIVPGFVPVGTAAMHSPKPALAANKIVGADHPNCSMTVPIVCGASYSSSSLPSFASAAVLMREAIDKARFPWRREGGTLSQALVAIAHQTGRPVKRNPKASDCQNRRCLDLERALNYVLLWREAGN